MLVSVLSTDLKNIYIFVIDESFCTVLLISLIINFIYMFTEKCIKVRKYCMTISLDFSNKT